MALDAYLYDRNNKEISRFSWDEKMHSAMFEEIDKVYIQLKYLRKLEDYYSDSTWKGKNILSLANDFVRYKPFLAEDYHTAIDSIAIKLSAPSIYKVTFVAD